MRAIRRPSRCLWLLLFVGIGCLKNAQSPSGAIDPDSVAIDVGTGGLARANRFARVRIHAAAKGQPFQGEVVISGVDAVGVASKESFRARFSVGTVPQTVELPILLGDWDRLKVRFDAPNVRSLVVEADITPSSEDFAVIFIGDGAAPAGVLPGLAPEWLKRSDDAAATTAHGSVPPRAMPNHSFGYDCADLVVLDRTALSSVDPQQITALAEWVERGGTLAVIPGPDWTSSLPDGLKKLMGFSSGALVPSADGASSMYTPQGEGEESPRALGIETEIATMRSVGAGRVVLFRVVPKNPLSAEAFLTDRRYLNAWKSVVVCAVRRFSPISSQALAAIEPQALSVIQMLSGFRFPSRRSIFLFVLVYLGAGFFGARAVARRLRRPELMYFAALAIAALSTVAIWRYGFLSGIRERTVHEVTVLAITPGSTHARAVSWVGISSPRHGSVQVDLSKLGPGAVAVQAGSVGQVFGVPYQRRPSASVPEQEYRVDGGRVEIGSLRLFANATRLLRIEYPVELPGALDATIDIKRSESTTRVLQVTNHTGRRLERFGPFQLALSARKADSNGIEVTLTGSDGTPVAQGSGPTATVEAGGSVSFPIKGPTDAGYLPSPLPEPSGSPGFVYWQSEQEARFDLREHLIRRIAGPLDILGIADANLLPDFGAGVAKHSFVYVLVVLQFANVSKE